MYINICCFLEFCCNTTVSVSMSKKKCLTPSLTMEIWSYPTVQWLGYLIKIWISPQNFIQRMDAMDFFKTILAFLAAKCPWKVHGYRYLPQVLLATPGGLPCPDRKPTEIFRYVLLASHIRLLHHEFKRQPKLDTWDEEIAWNRKFLDIWHGYCLILWLCSHLLKVGPVLRICCQDRVSLRNYKYSSHR